MNTTIRQWNPFKELENFQNSLNHFLAPQYLMSDKPMMNYSPAIDIAEDREAFHFKTELPGFKKEDIKVQCEKGVLTISGEKKFESEKKDDNKKYHRIESSYGSFMRSFSLPENTDSEHILAEYNNGILDVKVAKKALAAPAAKTITIK